MSATETATPPDAAVKPDGQPDRPKAANPAVPSAEEVAEYDAETTCLINEQATRVAELESEHEAASATKTAAKKALDAGRKELLALIARRQAERGKPPARWLFDGLENQPAPAWRSLPLSIIGMSGEVAAALAGIGTLGELHDQLHGQPAPDSGVPFGLKLTDVMDLRAELQEVIDQEEFRATAPAADANPYLWREYPVARWVPFGLTEKDVEKMAAGEVKRETGRHPITTVGDLSDFTQPTATGYTRGYVDIKGIGTAGADRISEAETRFWDWWGKGGEAEFAAEKGLSRATTPGPGSGVPATGDDDGADTDDTDLHPAEHGEPVGVRAAADAADGSDLFDAPNPYVGADFPQEPAEVP